MKNKIFVTKKLHITITEDMFESLRRKHLLNNIDVIISELLIEKFHLDDEVEE